MSTVDLSKDSKRSPNDVVTDIDLSDEALAKLPHSENTLAFLDELCEEELFNDAFLTLARTLPKQYAIIWALKCVEASLGDKLDEKEQRCVDLVKQWLSAPDDKLRREAMEAADDCDYGGSCAWLAAAVGFSGGSLAPENQAEVPPPPHLTAVAVAAGLVGLAVLDAEKIAEKGRELIDSGLSMVAIPG